MNKIMIEKKKLYDCWNSECLYSIQPYICTLVFMKTVLLWQLVEINKMMIHTNYPMKNYAWGRWQKCILKNILAILGVVLINVHVAHFEQVVNLFQFWQRPWIYSYMISVITQTEGIIFHSYWWDTSTIMDITLMSSLLIVAMAAMK